MKNLRGSVEGGLGFETLRPHCRYTLDVGGKAQYFEYCKGAGKPANHSSPKGPSAHLYKASTQATIRISKMETWNTQ